MRFILTLPVFTLFSLAAAHNIHRRHAPTVRELAREEIRAREHVAMARNCELQVREHVTMRMRKRAEIQKRKSYYTNIQNTTCLTAPEVVEGPYYVSNELVRQDIRETQQGVKLLMDFGVIDTNTCKPMDRAFVEIWQANATGMYGGYTALTFESSSSGTFNSKETWLRGGWYTDANGIAEVATIYPGFYDGRAPHIHIMVHKDAVQSPNGTIISHSGTVLHLGQAFFPDDWNDEVYNTSPYTLNTNNRTLNDDDAYLPTAEENGYKAYTSLQYYNGLDLSDGLVGYITLGVDTNSSYTIKNTNYNGQR